MPYSSQTLRQDARSLVILHLAFAAGQVLFAGVAFFIVQSGGATIPENADLREPLLYIIPAVAVAGIVASNLIFNTRIRSFTELISVKEKMTQYRAAFIMRCAMVEGPTLFAIIGFLLTGEFIFIYIAGALIVYFFTLFPTVERVGRNIGVSDVDGIGNDLADVVQNESW